jgi:hypothetical protein
MVDNISNFYILENKEQKKNKKILIQKIYDLSLYKYTKCNATFEIDSDS